MLFAEIVSTLRNTGLGLGFKPPSGDHWTRDMFMPGYKSEARDDYDWRRQKAMMNLIGRKPDAAKRREIAESQAEALSDHRDRCRQAEMAKARGATSQEIRLILEA